MPNSSMMLSNLQIVIDNNNDASVEAMEQDDSDLLEIKNNDESLECPTETQAENLNEEDNEPEFHVNLNKVPSSLQNTTLVDIYN